MQIVRYTNANGTYRYEVDGKVHYKASKILYTHVSTFSNVRSIQFHKTEAAAVKNKGYAHLGWMKAGVVVITDGDAMTAPAVAAPVTPRCENCGWSNPGADCNGCTNYATMNDALRLAYIENEQRNLTAANKVAESLFTILVQQHGASMTSEHVGDGIRRFEVTLNGHHLHITHDARTQVCVLRDGTRFEAATFLPELGGWLGWANGQGGRPSWLPEYEPAELVTQTVVDCFECQETHPAEPAGQTQTFGSLPPRPRYAVMCGSYLDYYTDEVVYTRTLAVRTPGLDLSARS